MGQSEIQHILMRKKKWVSTKEICIILQQKSSSISRSLSTMERYHEVDKKREGRDYYWKLKNLPEVKAL